jgi:GNAT superfamily N-acetyltransferase
MLLDGSLSMANMTLPSVYLGVWLGDQLIGVNSGHLCSDDTWRSRGLWVEPEYRGQGWGSKLLIETVESAPDVCKLAWSFPRRSSWSSYQRAGFRLISPWQASETSEANAYCVRDI